MKNDWKYTFSIVAINERIGNSSSLDKKPFFKITSSRPPPPLLQQPTENFITVASELEATVMIRAEIVLECRSLFSDSL